MTSIRSLAVFNGAPLGGAVCWVAPPPFTAQGQHTAKSAFDPRGVGTATWPPAGTYTWPLVGTFSWPRTHCRGARPESLQRVGRAHGVEPGHPRARRPVSAADDAVE